MSLLKVIHTVVLCSTENS